MADDGNGGTRMSHIKDDTMLTKAELATRWKVTTKTIETWTKENLCPRPKKLGKRRIRWMLADIERHEKKA